MALHGLSTLDLAGQGASDSATEAAVTGTLCQAFMSGALAPSAIADIMHAVAVSFPSALTQGVVRAALGAIHASHPRLRGSHALALGRALQEHVDASEGEISIRCVAARCTLV